MKFTALLLVVVLAGCAGSIASAQPTATDRPTPTQRPSPTPRPTPTRTPRPTPTATSAGPKVELHGPRSAALTTAAGLGWTCGDEFTLEDGNPAVICKYPGGTDLEGLVVIGSANDLLAVRMHTDEGARMAEFLFTFASDEITGWALDQISAIAGTGIVPVETGDRFDDATVRFEADENLLMTVTIQADDV